MKTHQFEHLVEGILLPFEVVGLELGQLLVGRRQAPFLEAEGKDGFAEGGDRIMESRIVSGCVRINHFLV